MNTLIEFSAWTDIDKSTVYTIFNEGFRQFHHVVDNFSRFDPKSELSKLNHAKGKETQVSDELFSLISFALEIAYKTKGAYDPTIIDFLQTYGYGAQYDFDRLQNKNVVLKEISTLLKKRKKYSDIKLDVQKKCIRLAPSQRIDLGSIGKGYAIDKAYEELKPLKNFLINAGGDTRACGNDQTSQPWLVEIAPPKQDALGSIQLNNKALCSSGSWARKVKFFHHLINPQTGKPQDEIHATFVQAESALVADAWSTALYTLGAEAEKYIRKHDLNALIVIKDKRIINNNFQLTTIK